MSLRQEIVAAIGGKAADRLCAAFGGVGVYIPLHPDRLPDSHPIIKLLGTDLARHLAARLGGEKVTVPVLHSGHRRRETAILDAYRAGKSTREIALDLGITMRRVEQVIAAAKPQ